MSDGDRRPNAPPGGGRAGPDVTAPAGRPVPLPPVRPCPACGGADASPCGATQAGGPGAIVALRCAECRLVFVDPVPPEAIAASAYDASYYEPWQERREERARVRMWRRRLRLVEERQTRGALLDIGCGDGLFLKVARDAGWSVEGIEFSPEGARRASHRLGRPVAVGDLARASGLRGPFDAVTLWHVLEHLVSPAPMIEAARARLRPGGLLAVAVPNLDNLPMRAAYRLARGRPLPLYEPGAREPHLSHFSADTLARFLRRHGFERVAVRADLCALSPVKQMIDACALALSVLSRRLLTDALVAFGRRPR